MKSLAAIRSGYAGDLIGRAADVVLKERRKLVLLPRESPLNDIHLENMLALSRMGVAIIPPVPSFYDHPKNLGEMIDHIVARVLDQFGLETPNAARWNGLSESDPMGKRLHNCIGEEMAFAPGGSPVGTKTPRHQGEENFP